MQHVLSKLATVGNLAEFLTLQLTADQVLCYRGHKPLGVYVIFSGRIEGNSKQNLDHSSLTASVTVFPHPNDIEKSSPTTITIRNNATAIFVPRSLILRKPSLSTLLTELSSKSKNHRKGTHDE